jgi:hypothetical protein
MTTAIIISELLPLHDDALLADIEHIFTELDRTVAKTAPDDRAELLLLVDELVDEMLAPAEPREQLAIELEIDLGLALDDTTHSEVAIAEVA